ncbi:unnamed protein product [Paramecium sonneborni]|uniref:EGF-like domain-containing protein n=1 Tax=Paramecium sonneborni TaxID=65129 RepID=A0A8S1NMS7_9CILI|nr:unnamed protein product [Paramecium sonneborni]
MQAQWTLVSEDLLDFTVSTSKWIFRDSCDWDNNSLSGSIEKCKDNDIRYILVGDSKNSATYTVLNLPPHYEVKVIVDGYFIRPPGSFVTISFNIQGSSSAYSFNYKDDSLQNYDKACNDDWSKFEIQTYTMTFNHNDNDKLLFRVCGTSFPNGRNYGIRSLQIYINQCHWSCLKCSSNNLATNCLACFTDPSITLGSPTTCSDCPTNYSFIEYLDNTKSCVTECNFYRIPDSNKVCQFNEYMLPYKTYFDSTTFTSSSPWVFVPDPINFNLVNSQKISTIPCQSSKAYVGPFFYNEGFSVKLSIPYNISYIRFRATIIRFNNWADYSAVHILLDDVEFASVYTISQVLTGRNADKLYSDTNCTNPNPNVEYYRLETKLKSNITNPILILQGSMEYKYNNIKSSIGLQSWGFRDVVMDIMKCQESCDWCDFDQKCYSCSSGFLYKNKCVSDCPSFGIQTTRVCQDLDEVAANSKYIIKAFYDSSNTTDTDVSSIVGTVSNQAADFKTKDRFLNTNTAIYFSYYLQKRVLGGPLVWFKAQFLKNFNLNPHYSFRFKFIIILGDDFDGSFDYDIGGVSDSLTKDSKPTTSTKIGRDRDDKYIIVDRTQSHFTSSFSVQLKCSSNRGNIKDNFCIIYDYFILILECTQYCTACTGPTWAQCTGQQSLPIGMSSPSTCINNTYYFDNTVTPAVCRSCTPIYCLECLNSYICTKCATNFYLQNGNCQCYPWTYLTNTNNCVNCHPLCDSCYGSDSTECLFCKSSQHRYLNNNQCVCQSNYYDDGINQNCQSICGDMIVTEGEDCDDGNTIRFDGCNNCKFECQKECQTCVNGQCSVCTPGYTLQKTMRRCYPTCGNGSIVSEEQCEDNNLTPYDGCFNCQFQCQTQCTNCIYGKCYQCDDSIGYYINLATYKCLTICGDLIVAGGEICDDGNNNPFDGCNNCNYSCDSFCDLCIKGICTKCKQGFYLLNKNGKCAPICGDKLATYYEECDDGNLINYDGCDSCNLACQEQCTSCIFGSCYECNTPGYQLNPKLKECIPICGDNVLSLLIEQCDDGNQTFEDGCFQCKYECQAECQTCAAGICYNCKKNYYLSSENACLPICGDGVITKYEFCDDYNFVIEDGCSNCTFQCEKFCTQCQFGICLSCQNKLILGDEQCDFGIIQFEDTIKNMTGCINCQLQCSSQCEICTQDSIITDYEECEDLNSQLNDGCNQCIFTCSEQCSVCIFGSCQKCYSGYTLIDQKCISICGDGIIAGNEECDTGIITIDEFECVNCKYKCSEGCNNCFYGKCLECKNNFGWYLNLNDQCQSKCGDLIISDRENCDTNSVSCDSCNFVCDDNCDYCKFGICQYCKKGYELLINKCISICGDSIQTNTEDCENDDIIPFDGCYQCQFQCQNECLHCINGECISCDEINGWYLQNKKCETKCGDGIITGQEQCDISLELDNGDISINQCFNCRFQCVLNCLNCDRGICNQCEIGFFLNVQSECESICGDQTNKDFEVCDDDNLDAFDGCFQCQYDCSVECQECLYGQCQLCQEDFYLDNTRQCKPICGDMKVTQYEECDDGNDIPYDGCYNCKYSCTENCQNCIKGVCSSCNQGYVLSFPKCILDCKYVINRQNQDYCYQKECQRECLICINGDCYQCQNGWYLNQVEHTCESMCGDNVIVGLEQCDKALLLQKDESYCNSQCQFACPYNCATCSFGICHQCQSGYNLVENKCENNCGDAIITEVEQCDDGNSEAFDGCYECSFDCSRQCELCVKGKCEICQQGYEFNNGNCLPICGDGIVTIDEDCDDQNSLKFDSCNQCKYECDQNCIFCEFGKCIFCSNGFYLQGQICLSICGDGLIVGNEQCDDSNLIDEDGCFECHYSCQQQCMNCQYGSCILCDQETGWHLTPQGYCQPFCGDQLIAGLEQCDDGNEINFDGCYECEFICQEPCTKCINGQCYECNTPGWKLENYFCWEVCGDALIVGIEECDDGNDIPYDGCFYCKTQCEEACIVCQDGQCEQCTFGWQLNDKQRCGTICGDKYVIPKFEDCDDGNLLPFDGCYECSYQCVQYCTDCRKDVCYECNTTGWTYDQQTQSCVPICGDGLVNGYEQCDDGNLIENDGCNNTCEFQCHFACLNCDNGKCLECDHYLGYFKSNKQCASACGDGLWEQNTEQCDDGNLINQDGCDKNCRIELDWYCKNEALKISNCIYKKQPHIQLKLLSQKDSLSEIEVTFSTQMMLQSNIVLIENNEIHPLNNDQAFFLIRINELTDSDYEYKIEAIVTVQEFPQYINYIIKLNLLNNVSFDQVNIQVFVDKKIIITEDQVILDQNSAELRIPVPYIQSAFSQKVVELFSNANEISMYAATSVSLISIFSSGYSNLFMTLDTIQYLYYTRYINLNFPDNLQQNMDNLKKSTPFQLVQNKLGQTGLPQTITTQSKSTVEEMPNKFKSDNLQYQFTSNIQTTALSLSAGLAIFITTLSISKLLHLIPPHKLNDLGSVIGGGILKVRQKCTKLSNDFVYSGAIRLITINFYEMQFASLLQLTHLDFNTQSDITNSSGAIATLAFSFAFTTLLVQKIRQIQTKQSITMKHYIHTILQQDNKDLQKSTWQIQYNTILLVKKSLYMFIIICLQSQGLYQTIGVATQAAAFATYLAVSSPFSNNEDQIKQMITELGMLANSLSFCSYYTHDYFSISKENLNQVGWFNIGIFTTVLSSNLAVDLITQMKILYKKVKKTINKLIESQKPSQSRVQPIFV